MTLGKGFLMPALCHRVTAGSAELQETGAGLSGKPETPPLQWSVCFGPEITEPKIPEPAGPRMAWTQWSFPWYIRL